MTEYPYLENGGRRRQTLEVRVGGVTIGGGNPVAVQSMTNTDTMDTMACVEQIGRIRAAGCRIVRLTTQGRKEAENLKNIREGLHEKGWDDVALVADVHFKPEVALIAADYADKVRINPGNYRDGGGDFAALVSKCKEKGVALRIGVNHGSLAPAIVEKYGDTPRGMVESAMEFLRECVKMDFDQVVVSMKSSNVRVMVHAYRMLAAAMDAEGMRFPLHLGVTEAGDGLDGRIKSAVGIGTLLSDGLGDTIRVSLTEPPENEIPVAQAIADHYAGDSCLDDEDLTDILRDPKQYNAFEYIKRESAAVGNIGGSNTPVLYSELDAQALAGIESLGVAVLWSLTGNPAREWRVQILNMQAAGDKRPALLYKQYSERLAESLAVKAACDFGPLFIDGLADGIWIETEGEAVSKQVIDEIALSVLQAARVRMSRTEYIACPGCGRTLFDLQGALHAVRERTSHLKGLKIAVMGCVVNGPGEMADADYGYVGAGRGMVTIYKGREAVKKAMPQEEAIDALISIIKQNGDWKEP